MLWRRVSVTSSRADESGLAPIASVHLSDAKHDANNPRPETSAVLSLKVQTMKKRGRNVKRDSGSKIQSSCF